MPAVLWGFGRMTGLVPAAVAALAIAASAAECNPSAPLIGDCVKPAGYTFGCAVNIALLDPRSGSYDASYREAVTNHCRCITPENDWKMENLFKPDTAAGSGMFTLETAKKYVDFVHETGIKCINGHVLVWHNQIENGPSAKILQWRLGRVEWEAWLKSYVETVVHGLETYSFKTYGENYVKRWDVVSEAFLVRTVDGARGKRGSDGSQNWRDSLWFREIGVEYFPKAFVWARNASVVASGQGGRSQLAYIDYSIEQVNDKSTHVLNKITGYIRQGVPIDGVGFQAHMIIDLDEASLLQNFERFADSNIPQLAISELDIRGACNEGSEYFTAQGDAYRRLAAAVAASGPKFEYVSTWGITDKYSWIDDFFPGNCNALPLSRTYTPKPALCGLINGLNPNADVSCGGSNPTSTPPTGNPTTTTVTPPAPGVCGNGVCEGYEICVGGKSLVAPPTAGEEWVECADCFGRLSGGRKYCCSGQGCVGAGDVFSTFCPNQGSASQPECPLTPTR